MDRLSDHYPPCPICKRGVLLPVVMGAGEDKDVKYRCTDPACGVRFDKHGYERYDEPSQEWKRTDR